MLNGIDNYIMREYSALEVFNKINVEDMLDRTDLNSEDSKAVLNIIDAMLVEGPVLGLSQVESPPDTLAKVLKFAEGLTLDEDEKRIIRDVTELKRRFDYIPEKMDLD